MTGGIPPVMPLAVVGGRVGVIVASREEGTRRVGRGIVFNGGYWSLRVREYRRLGWHNVRPPAASSDCSVTIAHPSDRGLRSPGDGVTVLKPVEC